MNRRRFFRVRASLRFTFAWEGGFELFRTVDLSASGAFVIRGDEAVLPALGVVGECAFNLESMEIRTAARVVRVSADGFGVVFEGLSRAHEDRVCGWIFRQETRRAEED
ncbi:MAG: PilZ domain-containing protein [Archangium sp.]|nr:PilZ domain-containing protein [Archangium sp.]